MVTEFAEITVKPGMEREFEAGVAASVPVFLRAAGCHGVKLEHSIEHPEHFILMVTWETVAHHMEDFRNSPDFQVWRGNVGHCFAAPPKVYHTSTVVG
ncbi:MAG: antibiotic biosynthesis monooxygenase [Acidocella sp. 20-57-95]|nr:MAG: antibiotic biosynthesis monooxygenase [Acidocella sp. 20-57-95]OYV59761.1 MAG: antibiotic biosynthesis monooxygenase [Acidocella sp. 21-58-7]HQT64648.1 antibiotic biosynthesis monooxygenase [Acidocella sp.]HQU05539.1 antibiotic biosynthesis monooxygenase [Acidocella sp.]